MIRLRRAYDPPAPDDGVRVLVDGVWPRGRTRDELQIERWAREVAPSAGLRTWFGHDPARWEEFRRRYLAELREPDRATVLDELAALARAGTLTLVYGARDEERNQAVVIRDALEEQLGGQ